MNRIDEYIDVYLITKDQQSKKIALEELTNYYNKYINDDFYQYSLAWLEVSDAILMIGNWGNSKGCIREYNFAHDHEIPIFTSFDSLLNWKDSK